MPEIGCNYSAPLMELLSTGHAHVDWIKLSRWEVFSAELAAARPWRPCLLHVLPHAGQPALDELPWNQLNAAVEACGSPHIALHLGSTVGDWEDAPTTAELVARLIQNARAAAEALAVPLLVENVPGSEADPALRASTDPAVIYEVCERAEVGLLLDLAHARVSAWHRGEEVYDYVAALPLHRVREIHVSGPDFDSDGRLRDRHLELQEEDYRLLSWTLERTRPRIVTLEYGGTGPKFAWRSDAAALERQLRRLAEIHPGPRPTDLQPCPRP